MTWPPADSTPKSIPPHPEKSDSTRISFPLFSKILLTFSRFFLLGIFGIGALREKRPLRLQVAIYRIPDNPRQRNFVLGRDLFQDLILLLGKADRSAHSALLRFAVVTFGLSPHSYFPADKEPFAPSYTRVVNSFDGQEARIKQIAAGRTSRQLRARCRLEAMSA
jgi:hypothetical protein